MHQENFPDTPNGRTPPQKKPKTSKKPKARRSSRKTKNLKKKPTVGSKKKKGFKTNQVEASKKAKWRLQKKNKASTRVQPDRIWKTPTTHEYDEGARPDTREAQLPEVDPATTHAGTTS